MTREELKRHCLKQIAYCEEMTKLGSGYVMLPSTHRKSYEEHKLILELLEESEKIRAEIEKLPTKTRTNWDGCCPDLDYPEIEYVDVSKEKLLEIIDKCISGGGEEE